jgi:hypothetical protein
MSRRIRIWSARRLRRSPHPPVAVAPGPSLSRYGGRGNLAALLFFSLSRKAGEGRGEGMRYAFSDRQVSASWAAVLATVARQVFAFSGGI